MATQVFADEELERLRGFPEIGRDELFRFFTLTSADVAFREKWRQGKSAFDVAAALPQQERRAQGLFNRAR